jgi:hypothetical protein
MDVPRPQPHKARWQQQLPQRSPSATRRQEILQAIDMPNRFFVTKMLIAIMNNVSKELSYKCLGSDIYQEVLLIEQVELLRLLCN